MILVLPMNPDVRRIINECVMGDSNFDNKIYCSVEYVIDLATALRANHTPPHIVDYIPVNYLLESRLTELIEILELYALAVLNELTINNMPAPYLVNVGERTITISDKEEYNNVRD